MKLSVQYNLSPNDDDTTIMRFYEIVDFRVIDDSYFVYAKCSVSGATISIFLLLKAHQGQVEREIKKTANKPLQKKNKKKTRKLGEKIC